MTNTLQSATYLIVHLNSLLEKNDKMNNQKLPMNCKVKNFNIYFNPDLVNWQKYNEEVYSLDDIDYYVDVFNSMHYPIKFKKVLISK